MDQQNHRVASKQKIAAISFALLNLISWQQGLNFIKVIKENLQTKVGLDTPPTLKKLRYGEHVQAGMSQNIRSQSQVMHCYITLFLSISIITPLFYVPQSPNGNTSLLYYKGYPQLFGVFLYGIRVSCYTEPLWYLDFV